MATCAYKIYPDLSLIIEYYKGQVTLESYKTFKQNQINDPLFDNSYCMLTDGRKGDFLFRHEEGVDLVNFLLENNKVLGKRNCAFLTETPDQVAKLIVLKIIGKGLPMNYEAFSSLKAAVHYIRLDHHYSFIEEEILKFKSL